MTRVQPLGQCFERAELGRAAFGLATAGPRFLGWLLLVLLSGPATAQESSGPGTLFTADVSAGEIAGPPPYVRLRLGRLEPERVAILRAATNPGTTPVRLVLNLFNNEQHSIVLNRGSVLAPGRVVLLGKIEGQAASQVVLALSGNALAGSVLIPGRGIFQIQPAGNGLHRIAELDVARLPGCGVQSSASPRSAEDFGAFQPAGAPGALETNTLIDLLVVYTPAARAGAGGPDGISALIDTAVTEANAAFENSRVNARLRLVHRDEIDYQETGDMSADLDQLEEDDPEDPAVQQAHLLRAQYAADLVCLITETNNGPIGLANQMTELEVEFSERAFSVVQRQYAIAYQVLAHELGHLMGCQHDRGSTTGEGCFSFSHAHRFAVSNVNYRTVMAPQPGLPIPYFSNPEVSFLGAPTGISESSADAANNARTINLTAETVARFSSVLRTGTPPHITLLSPIDGARYPWPGHLQFSVEVADDGVVDEVTYYVNGRKVAEMHQPPFGYYWTNSAPGAFVVYASAEDDSGWRKDSAAVVFTVDFPPPAFDPPGCRRQADGRFALRARALPGVDYLIEFSENLLDWALLASGVFNSDLLDVVDDTAPEAPQRFYRIRREF